MLKPDPSAGGQRSRARTSSLTVGWPTSTSAPCTPGQTTGWCAPQPCLPALRRAQHVSGGLFRKPASGCVRRCTSAHASLRRRAARVRRCLPSCTAAHKKLAAARAVPPRAAIQHSMVCARPLDMSMCVCRTRACPLQPAGSPRMQLTPRGLASPCAAHPLSGTSLVMILPLLHAATPHQTYSLDPDAACQLDLLALGSPVQHAQWKQACAAVGH